ncbi:MAG: hypothetical protein KC620_00250, partial [Myxococcales bacterium]|nr:hypothetical protein [Myxococcales bacterium]
DLITVECAAPGGPWTDRAAGPGDARRRSALGDGPIVATFRLGEDGDIVCRAASAMRPNPPRAIESTWRLFFVEPTFALESPAAAPTCLTASEVEIAGAGEHLTGNNPTLRAVLTDGGDFEQSVGLDPLGGGRFGARLDADALPDGNYTLRVEGEVFGRVPVTPIPAQRAVRVDRAGPTVVFLEPPAAAIIDLDPGTQGFQYAPRVQVCGAPGQPLTVERPDEAPYAVNLPEGSDCANVRLPTRTAALGPQTFVAHAADACGNATTTRLTTQVDPALVSARVLSPVDQARVNVESDADPARAGCQLEVSALVRGLSAQSPVDVCTSVAQGPAGALCDGRSSALSGRCEVAGVSEEGTTLRCPVSLNDGTHTLTVVGENGERVTSPSVSVRVDCAAPTVGALRIIEDVDANGCIHRQERQNVADAAATARVTLRFTVDGMEDGQAVRIRTDDGVDRGGALVQAGAGEAVITLPAGTHRLYLRGQDRAGNPLPEPGDVRPVTLLTLTVDPTPPTPALVGLVAGACLNGGADADPALADLQYALQVQSGRQAGEAVTAAASLDGAAPVERGGALDRVDFAPMTVGQGGHALRVTVSDACGNMGSVAGFARVGGRDDWSQPLPVAFSVDTIAPVPVLGGVRDGQVFAAEEDADGDAANGFQVDVSVGFAPGASVEGGRPIDLLVEGAPAVSSPSPLLAPADPAAIVDARLTLSGGAQSLVARATDACGNEGGSAPVRLTVDIAGCNSRVVGFAANPACSGPKTGWSTARACASTSTGRSSCSIRPASARGPAC